LLSITGIEILIIILYNKKTNMILYIYIHIKEMEKKKLIFF